MACQAGSGVDLGIPTWYKYLECDSDGTPKVNSLADLARIAAGIADILLFIAGVLAVFYMIYGGIRYITSQGQPDKLTQSKNIIIYSIVGLILSIAARAIINFVAGEYGVSVGL